MDAFGTDPLGRIRTRAEQRRLGRYLGDMLAPGRPGRRGVCFLQHDFDIANASGATVRGDLNNALQSIATQNSGTSAPSTTYARQIWADTTNNVRKRRNAANSANIVMDTLDESFVLSRSSNTILGLSDKGKTIVATAGFTQTFTAAATLTDGWEVDYRIESGATVVFDPNSSETIDGAATKSVTGPAQGTIKCNGSAFFTLGFGGTVTAATLGTSAMGASSTLINGTLVHSRGAGAETIAVKTLAGNDPSASDPVYVVFRNVTAATGDYAVLTLTAATSITINSTATMGAANATAFRLWVVGFNDGGTFRLGVINCLSGTSIYPLAQFPVASSTAMGTGADSAHVFYTGSAVTSKAYTVLGYASWESGLTTAGTWDAAPTRVQLFGAGVPLPGAQVQLQRTATGAVATGTTQLPNDDTIPQNTEGDEYMTQAITPSSTANLLRITAQGFYGNSVSTNELTQALFQDSTAGALAASQQNTATATGSVTMSMRTEYAMRAGTTSATTFKVRAGGNSASTTTFNGAGGARSMGGVMASFLEVQEVMA